MVIIPFHSLYHDWDAADWITGWYIVGGARHLLEEKFGPEGDRWLFLDANQEYTDRKLPHHIKFLNDEDATIFKLAIT